MDYTLDFERPVAALENQIKELKGASSKIDLSSEIEALQNKVNQLIKEIYQNLSPWERVLLSRHPLRPHTVDYIEKMITDFHPLAGDRRFGDDKTMIAGLGYLKGERVAVIGIEKGKKTKDKIVYNFGMPNPEGYRKALRVMQMASRFGIPVVTLVDTPGAYPGLGAEERGQSQAIAESLAEMFDLNVPVVSVVIGEGGSGGALGIAIADRVLMMEFSVYSVISPESCASILWSDPLKAEVAANSLKLTPEMAKKLQVIDDIIAEPFGGAHRYSDQAIASVENKIYQELKALKNKSINDLKNERFKKFRQMGNATIAGVSADLNLKYTNNDVEGSNKKS